MLEKPYRSNPEGRVLEARLRARLSGRSAARCLATNGLQRRRGSKIEVVVIAASRIERGVAMRTLGIGSEISSDGKTAVASAAENGVLVPLGTRPGFERMACESVVAVFARVEQAAAAHLDSDDVERRVVVEATGLRVELQAMDAGNHKPIKSECSANEWDESRGHAKRSKVQS